MIFEIRSTYTAMNKWADSWQNQKKKNDLCAQRRLRCPVWSESSQCAQWEARLIWVFAGRKGHFVGFVTRRLKCEKDNKKLILENQHRISIWVEEGCAGGGGGGWGWGGGGMQIRIESDQPGYLINMNPLIVILFIWMLYRPHKLA